MKTLIFFILILSDLHLLMHRDLFGYPQFQDAGIGLEDHDGEQPADIIGDSYPVQIVMNNGTCKCLTT